MERGFVESKNLAKSLILAGNVCVNNIPVDKPGTLVIKNSQILIKGDKIPYVSRGGLKLEEALKKNNIDVNKLNCLDVGASTGGFTDCLIQNGAKHVFAVDVGYGQLAWKLRQNPDITVIERTNIRYLKHDALPYQVDLITIDTSFISLKIVVPCVLKFLKPGGKILALIKPQFEVGKGKVGKGGVVRDTEMHKKVIDDLIYFFADLGLSFQSITKSPILGPKGNQEFVIFLIY